MDLPASARMKLAMENTAKMRWRADMTSDICTAVQATVNSPAIGPITKVAIDLSYVFVDES